MPLMYEAANPHRDKNLDLTRVCVVPPFISTGAVMAGVQGDGRKQVSAGPVFLVQRKHQFFRKISKSDVGRRHRFGFSSYLCDVCCL